MISSKKTYLYIPNESMDESNGGPGYLHPHNKDRNISGAELRVDSQYDENKDWYYCTTPYTFGRVIIHKSCIKSPIKNMPGNI